MEAEIIPFPHRTPLPDASTYLREGATRQCAFCLTNYTKGDLLIAVPKHNGTETYICPACVTACVELLKEPSHE